MPNLENVNSPINIHGIGRSGTTLLQNILSQTKYIQVCNETAACVFACYRGGQTLNPSHDKQALGITGDAVLASRALHAALCATMPSPKPIWCQKLGGIPNTVVWETIISAADRAYEDQPYLFPYDWYWKSLLDAFPHSRDVLILRDWRDVIVSRVKYSGYRADDVAADVATYFNMIAHPANRIGHVISYAEFVASPAPVVRALFAYLGLEYDSTVLRGMEWHAAPSADRTLMDARDVGFTWRNEYARFLTDDVQSLIAPAVSRLNERYGFAMSQPQPQSGRKSVARLNARVHAARA